MDDLKKKLVLIGSIEPGYTINIKTRTLMYYRSWYTSLIRTLSSEDIEKTLVFLESTIDLTIRNITIDMEYLPLLKQAKVGLIALKQTYREEASMKKRFDLLIRRIENTTTRVERQIISSIEQISRYQELMQASTNERDFESLCLIRQTPMSSHMSFVNTPRSQCKTEVASPDQLYTPPSSPHKETEVTSYLEEYSMNPITRFIQIFLPDIQDTEENVDTNLFSP